MNIKSVIAALSLGIMLSFTAGASSPVIPKPVKAESTTGTFNLDRPLKMAYPDADSLHAVVKTGGTILDKATYVASPAQADVVMELNSAIPAEGYNLDVTPDKIKIEASTAAGFFYALQTLRQLAGAEGTAIDGVSITDAPRFGWRGFMLDEGRHIFGKDEIKKVLDMMALMKMNRLHWHLTEDQGWRIEIPKYPLLTEVGANRPSTLLGYIGWDCDTVPYGGYYTQADIREIVAYAKDRFIEIVPEIDIPGHSQAAVAAYPEILACDPENPHEVWTHQGVSDDVINVANPAAVQFAKDVIDDVITLFPYGYLHLGGDECPTRKWEKNEACQKQLAAIGSDNYRDLQINFYKELQDHIAAQSPDRQRKLIFWNEVLHGNTDILGDDIVIMAWVGADKAALEAAQKGLNTILTPQIPYYINRMQAPLGTEPISQGRGTETVEAVYNYVPMKNVPADLQSKYMGVQANFWSEWVATPEFLEYLMMPRLAAVAEAAWTPQDERQYGDFRQRVIDQFPLYDKLDWNYARHITLDNGKGN